MSLQKALVPVAFILSTILLISPLFYLVKIPRAEAAEPVFVVDDEDVTLPVDNEGGSLPLMLHAYVDASDPANPQITMPEPIVARDDDPEDTVTITTSALPEGIMWEQTKVDNPSEGKLRGSISSISGGIPSDSYPISFRVNFTASDQSGSTEELLATIVVHWGGLPRPDIRFDRDNYLPFDNVVVTIVDPLADLDGIAHNDLRDLDTIEFNVTRGSTNLGPFTAQEVDFNVDPTAKSGTFVGTFALTGDLGSVGVRYSQSGSVYSQNIFVNAQGIKLDKSKYTSGEAVIVTVYSPGSIPSVNVRSNVEILASPITLDSVPGAPGLFRGSINLVDGDGPAQLSANAFDRVRVSRGAFAAEAEIRDVSVSFDRSSYTHEDMAIIEVIDYGNNTDPGSVQKIPANWVTVTSSLTASAAATPVHIELLETGVDSGVFSGIAYVGFSRTETSDDEAETIGVSNLDNSDTQVTVTYDGISDVATVQTIPPPPAAGVGSTSGNPAPATSIVARSNKACGSYGGDVELDGVCDGWEQPTKTYLTIPHGTWPATGNDKWHVFSYSDACSPCPHTSYKDVFLEIDTLETGGGPTSTVMPAISGFFDANGYKLHYVVDENINIENEGGVGVLNVWDDDCADTPPSADCDSATVDSFKEIKKDKFGKNLSGSSFERLLAADGSGAGNDRGLAKLQVYHYCLFSKTAKQKWDAGVLSTSGISEFVGNDCVVTLGAFTVNEDKEKGTLMHELGHNLGLHHGGGYSVHDHSASPSLQWISDYLANCKPNYISPMSYSRQFPSAVSGVYLSYWTASYSSSVLTNLEMYDMNTTTDPDATNEGNGPNPTTPGTVEIVWGVPIIGGGGRTTMQKNITMTPDLYNIDWDGDSNIEGDVVAHVINFGFQGCDWNNYNSNAPNGEIRSFDDWDHLVLDHRRHSATNFDIPGSNGAFGPGVLAGGANVTFTSPLHEDVNATIWNQILQTGITSLNNRIQILDDDDFESNGGPPPLVGNMTGPGSTEPVSITLGSSTKTTDAYDPSPIHINVGDTVEWTNDDTAPHTVTSGSAATADGNFDSGILAPGMEFSHTFNQTGDYDYFCTLHPTMVGTVQVAGGAGNATDRKEDFEDLLVAGPDSVLFHLMNNDTEGALDKLFEVREHLDQNGGGIADDDWITDNDSRELVLDIADANIQTLARERAVEGFTLAAPYQEQYYVIVVDSPDLDNTNAVEHVFNIEKAEAGDDYVIKDIIVNGSGQVTFNLQWNLVKAGKELNSNNIQVRVDDQPVNFTLADNDNPFYARSSISFEILTNASGTNVHEIEIASIQNWDVIVPEFPTLPGLVLAAVAIVSVIIASRILPSNRNSRLPFFGNS